VKATSEVKQNTAIVIRDMHNPLVLITYPNCLSKRRKPTGGENGNDSVFRAGVKHDNNDVTFSEQEALTIAGLAHCEYSQTLN